MYPYNAQMTEELAFLASLAPQSLSTGTTNIPSSNGVQFNSFKRIMWIIHTGALGSSGTVDFHVQASSVKASGYATLAGSASNITQITTGSENIVTVEIKSEYFGSNAIGPYFRGSIVIGTAASLVSVLCLGTCLRYPANTSLNLAVVTQQIAL